MNKQQQFDDRSPALHWYDTIHFFARQAGMERDKRVLKALRLIKSDSTDRAAIQHVSKQILNLIKSTPEFLAQQRDLNPFQPYPGNQVSGIIRIGKVYHPRLYPTPIFGLHPHEINQNVLVFGRAGAGKTVLLMIVLLELIRLGIPFFVCDFKRDYRHLIRNCKSLSVFNWRNFKFNPLVPPPNTEPLYWIQVFLDVFFEAFYNTTPIAAKSVFVDFLTREFNEFRKRYGNEVYPTLFDIEESIRKTLLNNRVPSSYKERLMTSQSRIRPLLSVLGNMFDCQEGFPIEELLNGNAVLELDGLLEEPETFLVNLFFHWIFTYRLNNGQRGRLRHMLVFDEVKKVASKEKASGSSTISRLISTAREFGQGLLVADQMPSALGHAILANVYTSVGLSLSAGKDINAMSYAMGLSSEQRQYINHLPVGFGIVKMADRYTRPFLIQIPNLQIKKDVSDAELESHMKPYFSTLNFKARVLRPETTQSYTAPPQESESPKQQETSEEAKPEKNKSKVTPSFPFDLTEKEYAFLMDLKNHPFLSLTEKYSSLGLTNYMGNRICQSLLEKGLVREIEIRLGTRGRSPKYLEVTQKAEKAIGRQNLGKGKGGFEHVYHQHRLQKHFSSQGFEAEIEAYRHGKAVDLALTKNDLSIAIELAMTPGGEVSNFEKDFEAGWSCIWSVCKDRKIMEQVQKEWGEKIAAYPTDLVEFYLISDSRFNSSAELDSETEN